jgi:hypothetical protein
MFGHFHIASVLQTISLHLACCCDHTQSAPELLKLSMAVLVHTAVLLMLHVALVSLVHYYSNVSTCLKRYLSRLYSIAH